MKIIDNSKIFSDCTDHWAADAIDFVAARELFNGTGANTFSPNRPMTRGMLMTVLARMNDVDTEGGSTWYEKGLLWAVEQGISDGTNPEQKISREQLVTMLYRAAGRPEISRGSRKLQRQGGGVLIMRMMRWYGRFPRA